MSDSKPWAWAAGVQYGDFHGSISLDAGAPGDAATRLAGLDENEWLVVGIQIYGGNELGVHPPRGWVLAARRELWAVTDEGISGAARAAGGKLPAQRIELSEAAAAQLLQSFKRWDLRAVRSELDDYDVDIAE